MYYLNLPNLPGSCNSILGPSSSSYIQPGYSYACGEGEASDGRLRVSAHNYHFSQARDIQFHFTANQQTPPPDEVFLLLNVTVLNIGGGNVSIGGSWSAFIFNGSSLVPSTMFIANASLPNTYPNTTIPDVDGGLYLPPGSTSNLWLFFYVPFNPIQSLSIIKASSFKLQFFEFNENSYGGMYEGQGQYDCRKVACTTPHVEFVIGL